MTEKLEIMEKRFDEINEKLTDINVINDQEQYKNFMKELKNMLKRRCLSFYLRQVMKISSIRR